MKRFKILIDILQHTGFMKFTLSFVSFLFMAGFGLLVLEPGILHYWDGLWFAFVTSTTVGYGDYQAVSFFGRLLCVLLTVYGMIFFAALSGVVINYYTELRQDKDNI
ncbi:two pore domain potassium channel family protein [Streptococcus danieliae]|uniref:Two pore domain potassium channel family protein n=1 Tax=Streptococcus danieliae TaxID=747656 RepID=A0A7X3G9V8_9STRE|nr:potassium channel family protein [Streptococcus danieliae]MBF0717278.1 two pore domain potassium channel family protein [Streptococcus danieliae]MVX59773.1 two pore domain potassium channel family protein [Streptococcus danieliae]NYS33342.1 two pore domain potassium channel family protein [Streptococcus danieliae]NYS49208.1 two pore domain potassium channel family protein [Streptococcus danieliae]